VRISRKVLILISMPLAFQLGMSAFLFDQVQSTQRKIEAELERKSIVATLDKIHHLHVRCLAAAAFYSINRDEDVGKRHIAMLKEMSGELRTLRLQTEGKAELSELTTNLQQAIIAVVPYEMLMRKLSLMESKPQLNQSQKARELIKDSMRQIEFFQSKLIPPVDDIEALHAEARVQLFKLGALLVVIVALTMALLLWSQKNILALLDALLAQIRKIEKGETIEGRLEKGTEVAELEGVVCESAQRIAVLENLRRELCSIVSHDVRAPMTTIGGLITLMEAGAFGQLSGEQESSLAKQKAISADLLGVLNNILDLDKLRSGKWNLSVKPVACEQLSEGIRKQLVESGIDFGSIEVAHSAGVFSCDSEAICRAMSAFVHAFASDETRVQVSVEPSLVSVKLNHAENTVDAVSHKAQTARGLAELFCQSQNLSLSVVTEEGCTIVSVLPSRSPSSGRESPLVVQERRSGFSKVGRRLQALISLPMAVSATAVILYGVLLNQFSHDIGRELVSREIVHRATSITSGITQLMLLSIRRVPGELAEEGAARDKVKARLDDDVSALQSLQSKFRLSQQDTMNLVTRKVEDAKALSDKLSAGDVDELPEMMKKLAEKEGALSSIAFTKAGSLLSAREEQDTTTKAMSDLRANVIYLLIGASVLTGLLTIYSARSIVREFIARLNNAAENARRLARREPLRQPDSGDDEIADLDAFFYRVACDIDKLEKERKHLSGLLREQLKLPLEELNRGFKSLLAGGEELNDKGKNRVQRTLIEIRRLSDLVDDLLLLDSLGEGGSLDVEVVLKEIAADEIVSRSIDAVIPQAELKVISIERSGNADLRVKADPSRSIQIVVNLLSNAVKFSSEDSSIVVSIEPGDDGIVRIGVRDRGRGIPLSEQSKIFSRFEQVEKSDSAKGSGLGLFISKKLAEAQNGSLTFESIEGEGTTFRLALPAVR